MSELLIVIVIMVVAYLIFDLPKTSKSKSKIPNTKSLERGQHIIDVVGESFLNDDGSSRPNILSTVQVDDEVQIKIYDYKGEYAAGILVDGKMIGNLPHGYGAQVFQAVQDGREMEAYIESVGKSSESNLYGATVKIIVN